MPGEKFVSLGDYLCAVVVPSGSKSSSTYASYPFQVPDDGPDPLASELPGFLGRCIKFMETGSTLREGAMFFVEGRDDHAELLRHAGVAAETWGNRIGFGLLRLAANPLGRRLLKRVIYRPVDKLASVRVKPALKSMVDEAVGSGWTNNVKLGDEGPAYTERLSKSHNANLHIAGDGTITSGTAAATVITIDVRANDFMFAAPRDDMSRIEAEAQSTEGPFAPDFVVANTMPILLGHELLHALRFAYGIVDPRPQPKGNYVPSGAATEQALKDALAREFGTQYLDEALVGFTEPRVRAACGTVMPRHVAVLDPEFNEASLREALAVEQLGGNQASTRYPMRRLDQLVVVGRQPKDAGVIRKRTTPWPSPEKTSPAELLLDIQRRMGR